MFERRGSRKRERERGQRTGHVLADFAFIGPLVSEPMVNTRSVSLGQLSAALTTQLHQWLLRMLLANTAQVQMNERMMDDINKAVIKLSPHGTTLLLLNHFMPNPYEQAMSEKCVHL